MPESKKDSRKYLIIYFNSPTRPELDPLPGVFFQYQTQPNILKNPDRWALLIVQKQLIELTTGVQASTALSKLSTSFNWSGPIGVARSIWGDDDNDEDDDDNVVDYDSQHQLA